MKAVNNLLHYLTAARFVSYMPNYVWKIVVIYFFSFIVYINLIVLIILI